MNVRHGTVGAVDGFVGNVGPIFGGGDGSVDGEGVGTLVGAGVGAMVVKNVGWLVRDVVGPVVDVTGDKVTGADVVVGSDVGSVEVGDGVGD